MKKPCNAETVNALYQSGRHVPDVLIPLIPRHTSLARIFVAITSADQASASRPIHERPTLRVLTLVHSHSSTLCPRHVRPPSCLHRKLLQLSRQSLPPNIRRRLWRVSKTSACSDRDWPVGQVPRGHGDGNRFANSGALKKVALVATFAGRHRHLPFRENMLVRDSEHRRKENTVIERIGNSLDLEHLMYPLGLTRWS
jgi:hypothetical protein